MRISIDDFENRSIRERTRRARQRVPPEGAQCGKSRENRHKSQI